eukprot:6211420-Pleurochrysis_carterae.AAC.1
MVADAAALSSHEAISSRYSRRILNPRLARTYGTAICLNLVFGITSASPGVGRLCMFDEGVAGEEYSISPEIVGGPAFLIYYSPAFLRHCSAQARDREACARARGERHLVAAEKVGHSQAGRCLGACPSCWYGWKRSF